jgi:hypothetical protein
MVEGIVAPLVEMAVALVSVLLEVCFWVLVASARPWRYVLSSSYRTQVDTQMKERSGLYRGVYLLGGTAALLSSIVVLFVLVRLFFPPPELTVREKVIQKAEQMLRHRK